MDRFYCIVNSKPVEDASFQNPARSDVCYRGRAYAVLQTVQLWSKKNPGRHPIKVGHSPEFSVKISRL